jgi:hypothetical protein
VPPRPSGYKRVFHLYIVSPSTRWLFQYCLDKGIAPRCAPIPLYRQKAWLTSATSPRFFRSSDRRAREIISFHMRSAPSREQQDTSSPCAQLLLGDVRMRQVPYAFRAQYDGEKPGFTKSSRIF